MSGNDDVDFVLVLNALRHHCEEDTTRVPRTPRRDGVVLNALRHHCEEDRELATTVSVCLRVLNALRHHCEEDGRAMSAGNPKPLCSTPCGITARRTWGCPAFGPRWSGAQRLAASLRGGRPVLVVGEDPSEACSTPCGITARRTCAADAPSSAGPGAQRLAASLRGGRAAIAASVLASLCSTPCGITARRTSQGAGAHRGVAEVLNALRHHCEEDSRS